MLRLEGILERNLTAQITSTRRTNVLSVNTRLINDQPQLGVWGDTRDCPKSKINTFFSRMLQRIVQYVKRSERPLFKLLEMELNQA